jgi:fibronectin type 3 domain-containing protein
MESTKRMLLPAAVVNIPSRRLVFASVALACCLNPAILKGASTITYVQGAYTTPQTPQTAVSVKFAAAQSAGDLNVVAVGWNDSTATVVSVADTSGNTYTRAVGPTVISGMLSQSIYYAKNILSAGAGANSVTVTFSAAAIYPDIRILEYNGADPNSPVDVTAAATGNSATSNSGSVTTTNATDLLFGANTVQTTTLAAGSGFTSRLLTSPDGDMAEDSMVTASGSYSATAPLIAGQWIMQMVAFRTAGSGPAPPTIGTVAPTGGPTAGGTPVTITGTNFASGATVMFGTAAGTSVQVVSATQITARTPAGTAGPVTVTVTVSGQSGSLPNGFTYTVPATVTGVSPASGTTSGGTPVTITGTNFAAGATVTFGAAAAGNVVVVSGTQITATTPAGSAGPVTVTVNNTGVTGGSLANGFTYLATNPTITFMQGNYAAPQSPQTTVNVSFTAAQAAGDLNVVVAGWNDSTASVTSVTDSRGNVYTRVVGPTAVTGSLSQAIYCAKNIAAATAGANTVSVAFSPAAAYPDIRVLEYAGADPNNPVDVVAAGSGTGVTGSSGSATTTSANDLLFGANMVSTTTTFAGPSFISRMITVPDSDIAEDQMVTATGSYSATATLISGQWVMQMVAFRASGGSSVTPPTAPGSLTAAANRQGPVTLSWTASTSSLGIADYIVQRCQGTGCTNFAQTATTTGTTYTDSAVAASITYCYRVQAADTAGNLSQFSNVATVTTVGTQPPTAPTNLTGTAASSSEIDLGWTASTSSIGLANYVVQRCQGTGCSNFAQVGTPAGTTYADTGLTPGTSYSYQVEAIDIEGNVSPFSNIATAVPPLPGGTITFVQGNWDAPQGPQATVSFAYTGAQTAGDLNVVVVGWNDSAATVKSVVDKSGNTYTLAVGPTVLSGFASQSIYYAKNIAAASAGANSVTVTFSAAAAYPDIRILEYSGADRNNPVDVVAGTSGTGVTSSSGSATTTNPTDLLFGANLVQNLTTGPGAGFTSRMITSPDGDIAEDQMVTAIGSYAATAAINTSGQWLMQMVAFRAGSCSGTPPSAPGSLTATAASISQINLSWTAPSSCSGISHYMVQRCQGAGCSNFAQVGTSIATSFQDTGLAGNTSYSYKVQAVDNTGLSGAFSSPATAVTLTISISPRTAALTFTRTQQFTSAGGSGVIWKVDGVSGGSTSSGTITTGGLYTPPSTAGTHTVSVTTSDGSQSASATVYITNYPGTFTHHNDNLRTGQNLSETVLTLTNINATQFGKLFSYPIDGIAFASPLYVANVSIPGQGNHNVVYVATEHDSVYAFDADGLSTSPLWHISFLSSGVTTVPCGDTGECGDIPTEIGITSTPVIDPSSGIIYVVAATKEGSSSWVQRLHALDITTGAEKFGGPVVIQASISGTGSGSSGGKVGFDGLRENQRTGLLLSSGIVYLGFGSHGDNTPWHGWILGYNATTLKQTMMFNATPNGNGGGIWHGGGGLATDATGDLYFVTSNGDFDVNTGGVDYGDSVVKLTTTGTVADYFTPYDQQALDVNNLDLGAGGPVMLVDQTSGPVPHLLITAGKDGTIYVCNRDNLGQFNPNNNNQIVQSLVNALPNGTAQAGNFSTPVFYNGYVYFGAINDNIRAFQLTNGQLSTSPTSISAAVYNVRGASFAISANVASNGVLWALQNNGASANNDVGNPGVLFAYDATNLSKVLYTSSQSGTRDTLDYAAKFSIPLVANGKVFVAGQTQLTAFGLLP